MIPELPEGVYKRRHYGTPETMMLHVVNYIIMAMSIQFFAMCKDKINWFFWVMVGGLAIYNFFTIRKYREEYDRKNIIAYVISVLGMVLMFFLFRLKAHSC